LHRWHLRQTAISTWLSIRTGNKQPHSTEPGELLTTLGQHVHRLVYTSWGITALFTRFPFFFFQSIYLLPIAPTLVKCVIYSSSAAGRFIGGMIVAA
jgi:hypothetical protein